MLNITPGSICDVCLEPFGRDTRIPTSVLCGHIFCSECINNLRASNAHPYCPDVDNGAPCPLCRTRFDQRSITRLIIDFESHRGLHSPVRIGPPTLAEVEAKRFHDAFATVARDGITEQALRQLLDDAKSFLSSQSRDQFKDLRVLHRVIAYLCETKTKLRDEKSNHEKELLHLHDEKMLLENRFNDLVAKRKNERSVAIRNEEELRDYCKNLQGAYESMIRHYNFLVDEWQKLTEDNERLRAKQYDSINISPSSPVEAFPSPEGIPSTLFNSYHELESRFRGAAAVNPNTFIISPLPEFTCLPLPSANSLPALEDEQASFGNGSSVSNDVFHTHIANSSPDNPSSEFDATQLPSNQHGPSFVSVETSSVPTPIPPPTEQRRHKSTRHRDSTDVRRSGSRSIRSSRSRAPSRDRTATAVSSGSTRHLGGVRRQDEHALPDVSILSAPLMIVAPHGHGQGPMNNRLQDLLTDPSVSTASSLPNMPIYHPPLLASDSNRPREKDRPQSPRSPSRSRTASVPSPRPVKQDKETISATESPSFEAALSKAPVPDLSNCPVSTASMAAQAAEKAKQERRRAEQEAERERRKSERMEKERIEHDYRRRSPPAPVASPISGIASMSTQSINCQPAYAASSAYASHRTGTLSRSSLNSFSADKHATKVPLPVFGRV